MTQTFKKSVSILLSIIMILSVFTIIPMSASAEGVVAKIGDTPYETLEAAFAAAQDGDTITVIADCAGNGIVAPQGKFQPNGLTVNFDGHTYTVDGETVGSTGTKTNAFQLLKNNNITFKNGTVYSEKAKILIQNYSNLTLDNMTLTLDNPNYTGAYTFSNNNGDIVIEDSTINANPAGGFAFDVCRYASYPSVHVTVKGNSEINGDVEIYASNNNASEGFGLTLESGTLNGGIVVDDSAAAAMEADPTLTSITKEEAFVQNVAVIDDAKYQTLEAAFAAAQDGDTISVIADCSGNGIKVLENSFNTTGLTVDFNGHTYTVTGTTVGSTNTETQGFQLLKNNKITFEDGAITGSSLDNSTLMFLIQNYSDLTLYKMDLSLIGTYYNQYTLSNNNGEIVIDDSTINAPDYSWANLTSTQARSFAFDVCRFSSYPSVNVTVKGNSVINGDVQVDAGSGDPKDGFSLTLVSGTMNGSINLTDGAKTAIAAQPQKAEITKATTFTQTAPAGYMWVDGETEGSQVIAKAAAKIGDTSYLTLEEAFTAAVDGDTITLLANCAGNGIIVPQGKFNTTGLIVDFAGYTYTVDGAILAGSTGTKSQAFQLLKNNKITFKNGTVYSEKAKMIIQNYSDLTLDKMTLTIDNENYAYAYTLSNNNGSAVIKDTTINANPAGGFAFDVCRYASYPSIHVTVTGDSVINGNVEVDAGNGDPKEGFSLTLESGELNGNISLTNGAKTAIADEPEKAEITKAAAFTQDAPAGYMWVDSETEGTQVIAKAVAKINDTTYATLEAAFAAAHDGDTITLLADCAGNGIIVPQGKFNTTGLIVDFAGYTYTVDGAILAGSTGTKSQAFQLLKNNKITFKNGTVYSEKAKMIIQNYSDLTLDKMTLTIDNENYAYAYTLSNNNGSAVIKDTTINANPAGGFAFDVCRYASYPSIHVTVTGDSVINGNVEVDAGNGDPKDGFSLTLDSGTMTGDILLTQGANTALANDTADKAEVTKATAFTQEAPVGFVWEDTQNGQTLVPSQSLTTGHSITLEGDIDLNFYLNPALVEAGDKVTFTWTVDGEEKTEEVTLSEFEEGKGFKAAVNMPAAEMKYDVTATVEGVDGQNTYSVKDYCDYIIENSTDDKLVTLAKRTLDYGAKAQVAFDRTEGGLVNAGVNYSGMEEEVTIAKIENAIAAANGGQYTVIDLNSVAQQLDAKYFTTSLIFLSQSTLRIYFTPMGDYAEMMYADQYDGNQGDFFYYVEKKDIAAADLDQRYEFTINNYTFSYSALDYVKAVLESTLDAKYKALAESTYLYFKAANDYFPAE